MRLIDADELKERFCEENCGKNRCVDHMDKCAWILLVEESKTAFDVDKVVEQLEKEESKARLELMEDRKTAFEFSSKSRLDAYKKALEIVKGGVV